MSAPGSVWPAEWFDEESASIVGVEHKRFVAANDHEMAGYVRTQVKFRRGEGGDRIMCLGFEAAGVIKPLVVERHIIDHGNEFHFTTTWRLD